MAQGVPGRLRPRIFLTFRHYKGARSSAKRTGRLYLRRNPWYSLSEAQSTSGHMVRSGEPRKKSAVTPPGIDPGTVRVVAQCLNHYATPRPEIISLMWRYIHVNCLLLVTDFGETWIFSTEFRKIPKYQISWKPVELEPTDVTKLTVASRSYERAKTL